MGAGKVLALQTWAGLVEVPVAVVGATRRRLRVRVLSGQVRLPSRRVAQAGDEVLVPGYAVRDVPAENGDVPAEPGVDGRTGMYEPYDKATASATDRVAWALCQIIDEDSPLRWTRYRFAAECIATNPALMTDLKGLAEQRLSSSSTVAFTSARG